MPRQRDTYPNYYQQAEEDPREDPVATDEDVIDVDPNAAGAALAYQHGGANEGQWTSYVRTSASGKKYRVYTQRTADGGVVTVDAEHGATYTAGQKTAADTKRTVTWRDDGAGSRTETAYDSEGNAVGTREKQDPVSQGQLPIKVDEQQGRAMFWVPPDQPGGKWTTSWVPWGLPKTISSDTVVFAPNTDIPVAVQFRDGTRKDLSDKEAAAIQASLRAQGRLPSQKGQDGTTAPATLDLTGGGGSGGGSGRSGAQDYAAAMQAEKMRRDLLPEQQLVIQNHYDTIDWIQGQIAAGAMTPEEGEKYLAASKAYMEAALKGTTPFQDEQFRVKTRQANIAQGADMIQQRVQQQNALASGLLQALVQSKVMSPKGGGNLDLDVLGIARNSMAQDYGPNYSPTAQGLLAGALPPEQIAPSAVASLGSSNPFAQLGQMAQAAARRIVGSPEEQLNG